jgi:type I restriction enzyme R subunit
MSRFNEVQKEIISEMLTIYKNKDISEIERIDVLKLNNFDRFGGIVPIVRLFGGKESYKKMIKELENLIYCKFTSKNK